MMTTGRVNVGGGGGVKKLYRLLTQSDDPTQPKAGDIWVKNARTVTGVTLSTKDSSETVIPVNGQLHIQFMHVLQEFNFREISSQINGAYNVGNFVYDISSLTIKVLEKHFIPLFQKDEVKQYAILVSVKQYNGSTNKWDYLESNYHDGVKWNVMNYKFYMQLFDGSLLKLTKDLVVTKTVPALSTNGTLFKVDNVGNYWTQNASGNGNSNFTIQKFSADGDLLLSFVLKIISGSPATAFHVDDFENVYVIRSMESINGAIWNQLRDTFRYIDIYKSGLWVSTMDLGTGNKAVSPRVLLDAKSKLYLTGYDGYRYCDVILDLNLLSATFVSTERTVWKSDYIVEGDNVVYLHDDSTSATVTVDVVTRNLNNLSLVSKVTLNPAQSFIAGKGTAGAHLFFKKYGNDYVVVAGDTTFISISRFNIHPTTQVITSVYKKQMFMPTNTAQHPPMHRGSSSICLVIDDIFYVISRNVMRSVDPISGDIILEKRVSEVSSVIFDFMLGSEPFQFQYGIG